MPGLVGGGTYGPGMATRRGKLDNRDGIITAQLQGTAGRYATRRPLDVDAAVAELHEIAGGRADLLGEVAGRALGFGPGVGGEVGAAMWPKKALEAALLIAVGADLTRLPEWVTVGMERAGLR
jgi:hypothetical protein